MSLKGNLLRGLRDLARHPIWGARADWALAYATIMGKPIQP
jgi:hypothetical protein